MPSDDPLTSYCWFESDKSNKLSELVNPGIPNLHSLPFPPLLHLTRRFVTRVQALITLFANITFFSCPKPIPPSSSLHRCILRHIFLTPCQSTFNHPHDYLNLQKRHNNTFSHHPAPAQCTPSLPCNLLSSHVKYTILYSFKVPAFLQIQ